MRIIPRSIITILLFAFINSYSQDYLVIKSIISDVNADSLMSNLNILTGTKPVIIDGKNVTISSRYRGTEGNANAALFLKNKLSRYKNLKVTEQQLQDAGKNIIAVQSGSTNPKRQIIICAHFDSMPSGALSPGADDNGTGSAAVLEAARVISKYSTTNTIIYALFDQEEDNLNGSEYFASLAEKNKDSIIAVINLDMIGWDKNGFNDVEVIKKDVSTSAQLATFATSVNDKCQIGTFITVTTNKGARDADNVSFWNHNFPAILIIELYGPQNLTNHKTTDIVQNINKSFFEKCTKLGIATAASNTNLSVIDGVTGIKDLPASYNSLQQNYPNPFNPETTISYQVSALSYVSLKVYDMLGREVATLVDEIKKPGSYNSQFLPKASLRDNSTLSSGIYFYQLKTGIYSETKKMLLLK